MDDVIVERIPLEDGGYAEIKTLTAPVDVDDYLAYTESQYRQRLRGEHREFIPTAYQHCAGFHGAPVRKVVVGETPEGRPVRAFLPKWQTGPGRGRTLDTLHKRIDRDPRSGARMRMLRAARGCGRPPESPVQVARADEHMQRVYGKSLFEAAA